MEGSRGISNDFDPTRMYYAFFLPTYLLTCIIKKNSMKRLFFLVTTLFTLLFTQQFHSQTSILERLDAIKTSFSFTSEEVPLTVLSQHILKYPIRSTTRTDPSIVSYGEDYFLEIELLSELTKQSGRRLLDAPYVLRFYSERGEIIGHTALNSGSVKMTFMDEDREKPPRFIRISLRTIPFTLLERTSRIDIIELVR